MASERWYKGSPDPFLRNSVDEETIKPVGDFLQLKSVLCF